MTVLSRSIVFPKITVRQAMSGITNFNCNWKAHSDRRSFELDQELAFLRGDERLIIHDSTKTLSKGAFLVRDNRIFNGPLGRSLSLFACTAHSIHSLCSALLCYTRFARLLHSQAGSLTLLTPS